MELLEQKQTAKEDKAHADGSHSITISTATHALIECLDSLNKHWEQTRVALSKTYGEKDTYDLMEQEYNPAFDQLKTAVQGFLLYSIEGNMGKIDYKEI
ncbi:hypothetical protein LJC68_09105 [Bacteroidales bacterium OttesenSCG-928-B11]|nr:hypothetical protein [Bacteroidales bacterium OttesenSCG-928-E04]MDL2313018.1 hypothetical protein [Bacteroidales bacterium OttesenSCG-928-B11]MDL2326649.1 hypothetical protein [Bacteroidales bacterium OttesenSCG-928-A14]